MPGQYKIEVEKIGFRRFARDPIAVEVQSTVRIDVGMQVGDVNQIIEVTAQTPSSRRRTPPSARLWNPEKCSSRH